MVQNTSEGISDPTLLFLSKYLQPWQEFLGGLLIPARGLHGVLCWHDPRLTTWLALIALVVAAVAPLLPWLLILRATGLLLLGPHWRLMGWISAKANRDPAAPAKAAEAYAEAAGSGKKMDVLGHEAARRLEEKKAALLKEEERRNAWFEKKPRLKMYAAARGEGAACVEDSLLLSSKFVSRPDPARSSCYPRPPPKRAGKPAPAVVGGCHPVFLPRVLPRSA